MDTLVQCVLCDGDYRLWGRGHPRGFCPACRRAIHDARPRSPQLRARKCKRCDAWITGHNPRKMFCSKFCFEHWRGPNRRAIRRAQLKRTDMTDTEVDALRLRAKRCPICRCGLTDKRDRPNSKHLDHILGLHVGGSHTRSNVRILCRTCNLARPKDCSDQHIQLGIWESMTLVTPPLANRAPTEFEARQRRTRMAPTQRKGDGQCPKRAYPPTPMVDTAVRTLHHAGMGQKAIARRLGIPRYRIQEAYWRMALTPHAYTQSRAA